HQRDALTQAADNLFSDMRVVGAGDLRVNASVSNDPVGLLANAFNLTVGRFRRLVLRTRTSMQQIDVVFRQEIKHAESSIAVAKSEQTHLKAGQEMPTLHTNIANALSLITTIEGEIATSAQERSLDKRHPLSSNSTSVSKQELAHFYLEFAQEIITATSKLRS